MYLHTFLGFTLLLTIGTGTGTEVKFRNLEDGWFLAINDRAEEGSIVGCLPESNSRSQVWDVDWSNSGCTGTKIPSGNQGSSSRTQILDEDHTTGAIATWGDPGFDMDNQIWLIRQVSNGLQLVNKASGRCLTGRANIQALGQPCNGNNRAQIWERVDVGGGGGHCEAEINKVRSDNGKPPVTTHSQVESAAQFHTNWMHEHDCFSHQCDGEPGMGDRLKMHGYYFTVVGEIIAGGGNTCQDAVNMWLGSPGHFGIMIGDYIHVGCAGRSGMPWTCNFAKPMPFPSVGKDEVRIVVEEKYL